MVGSLVQPNRAYHTKKRGPARAPGLFAAATITGTTSSVAMPSNRPPVPNARAPAPLACAACGKWGDVIAKSGPGKIRCSGGRQDQLDHPGHVLPSRVAAARRVEPLAAHRRRQFSQERRSQQRRQRADARTDRAVPGASRAFTAAACRSDIPQADEHAGVKQPFAPAAGRLPGALPPQQRDLHRHQQAGPGLRLAPVGWIATLYSMMGYVVGSALAAGPVARAAQARWGRKRVPARPRRGGAHRRRQRGGSQPRQFPGRCWRPPCWPASPTL